MEPVEMEPVANKIVEIYLQHTMSAKRTQKLCQRTMVMDCSSKKNEILKKKKDSNSYILQVGPNQWTDAKKIGNVARFINHSCTPNLECVPYTNKHGYPSARFRAIQNIKVGEKLTFDYGKGFSQGIFAFKCECVKCA